MVKSTELGSNNMKIASKTTDEPNRRYYGKNKEESKPGDGNSNFEYSDCEIITKKMEQE